MFIEINDRIINLDNVCYVNFYKDGSVSFIFNNETICGVSDVDMNKLKELLNAKNLKN